MLELACMKDEPLPEKRVVTREAQVPPPALMVSTTGLSSDSMPDGAASPTDVN